MNTLRKIIGVFVSFCLILLSQIVLGQEIKTRAISETYETTTSGEYTIKKERNAQFFLALKKPIRLPLFYDDASLFRFVSKDTPLTSRGYKPDNLVSISGAHINEAGRIGYIRSDAKKSLLELAGAFEAHFGEPLVVISGYRSAAYQERMWNLGKCHDTLCAPPGYSEHQLGLAVDLFDTTNQGDYKSNKKHKEYITWMQKNGHFYGWHQSYQKGAKIDSYEVEPWHWRYLGKEMATKLKRLDWTFTEYVRFQEAIERR